MNCVSDTEQEDLMTGELTWFEMGVPDATRAQSFLRDASGVDVRVHG
jgi:hypothetical protein